MKFNWGTGILIFLIVFLLACAVFIVFAFKQDVNLVHENYYEKGVDYTEQMNVDARSVKFNDAITIKLESDFLILNINDVLASKIDSGNILLYRPSSSKNDISFPIQKKVRVVNIPKKDLISGRYILKFFWYAEGLKYELDRPVNIQ